MGVNPFAVGDFEGSAKGFLLNSPKLTIASMEISALDLLICGILVIIILIAFIKYKPKDKKNSSDINKESLEEKNG